MNPSRPPTIQELRTEAHHFFGQLQSDLALLEADLRTITRKLEELRGESEKVARRITNIEADAVEKLDAEFIRFLNEADEMGERAEAL